MLKKLKLKILMLLRNALFPMPRAGGLGVFDSVGGDYDEQTGFTFDTQLYIEAYQKSMFGSLTNGKDVSTMIAGGPGAEVDRSACVVRKEIKEGDMARLTMQEALKGTPTWGDNEVQRGAFQAYKNLEARANEIDTPAFPLPGRMALQRARMSLKNPKGNLRNLLTNYMAQEIDYEHMIALLWGASKSALQSVANGGLAVNLGVGTNGTAGTPLMGKNFYSIDAGFAAYNDTPATWNSTVNGHVNTCTAGADALTILKIKVIRRQLDAINFAPVYLQGQKYKAIALCDPDLWYRLDHLLKTDYGNAKPRKEDHNIFGVDHQLVYHGILFLNAPNMEIFRLGYQASPAYPTIGPGLDTDPRDYTTSSSVASIIFMGAGALFQGYNGKVNITEEKGYMGKGYEVGANTIMSVIRGEWYAKDGRASAAANCYCNSVLHAIFYEAGVGSLT